MAIFYSEESIKKLMCVHADNMKTSDLVLGFATWKFDCGDYYEKLYVHTPDGELFETGPHCKSACFEAPNRVWRKTDGIPAKGEFIGTYRRPLGCKAQAGI